MFTEISPTYDLINRITSFGADRIWRKRLIKRAAFREGERVLDIATGTADLPFEYQKMRQNLQIVGVDLSRGMLELGVRKLGQQSAKSSLLIQGDALSLPFEDESFDVVSISFGLRNLIDRDRGLAEMSRVMKPGGRLLILEFSLPTFAPWRGLFRFYLKYLVPLFGGWISGSRTAYQYLHDSVDQFPTPLEIETKMKNVGFAKIAFRKFLDGVAVLYFGVKG